MVRFETTSRNQKAVLYASSAAPLTSIGQKKVDAAVELDVRWEEGQSDALDANGEKIRVDALVVVDRDITIGSLMWLGAKDDLPSPVTDLKEVVAFAKIPNEKGTTFRRTVGLIRYSNSLPPIAS